MCKVRGIGVAERVRTSTVALSDLSHSLSSTPNRCSSSITTRPRSLKVTSFWTIRWVPIRMSTPPVFVRLRTSLTSDLGRNRLTASTVNGNSAILAEKLRWCCSARIVVGHQHGDLLAGVDRLERGADGDLGLAVADVAADQAVHRLGLAMSSLTDSIAESWSGVS